MVVGNKNVDAAAAHLAFEIDIPGDGGRRHTQDVHKEIDPKLLGVLLLVVLPRRHLGENRPPAFYELFCSLLICHGNPITLYTLYIESI